MRLRATVHINSSYGTYPVGRRFEVPDEIGRAWIQARIAEEATAAEVHEADAEPAERPLHKMNKAQLTAIAEQLGLDTGGTNRQLVERISAAREPA